MEHYKIQRDIQGGKISPCYLLQGEEPFFVDEIVHYIENHVLEEAEKAFNQTVVYGRDVSLDKIVALAKGFPMMGERQVIIVKEAQDIAGWKKEEQRIFLEKYLDQPQTSTMLVFAFKNKKLDGKLKVAKLLKKVGVAFESKRIREWKLPEWIDGFVQSKGYSIDKSSSQLLGEYLGNDLGKLVNELNKLMIIIPEGSKINTTHIEENIGISKDFNVWELQKAIASKDIMKSNRIINYFEANPKSAPIQMVLPALYNYFSKLLVYSSLKDKSKSNVQSKLRVAPFVVDEYARNAANFKPQKLEKIISYIRDCDRKAKGVDNYGLSHGTLMKELVFKMLHY